MKIRMSFFLTPKFFLRSSRSNEAISEKIRKCANSGQNASLAHTNFLPTLKTHACGRWKFFALFCAFTNFFKYVLEYLNLKICQRAYFDLLCYWVGAGKIVSWKFQYMELQNNLWEFDFFFLRVSPILKRWQSQTHCGIPKMFTNSWNFFWK